MAHARRRRHRPKASPRRPSQAKSRVPERRLARQKQARAARFSGPVCAVIAAITIGVGIGICYGNLGRAVKAPGEAYQTDDATGSWYRYVMPGVEARRVTLLRLRQIRAALLEYSLAYGGSAPAKLEELVSEGLLRQAALEDGWEEPFLYDPAAQGEARVRSQHLEQAAGQEAP